MTQLMKCISTELLTNELKLLHCIRSISTSEHQNGRVFRHPYPKKPIVRGPRPELAHFVPSFYRWDYKPLPTKTSLNEMTNPMFAVKPPEFKLRRKTGVSRQELRQKSAEIAAARRDPELERLARRHQLLISIDEVEEEWRQEFGLQEISNLASFYGIHRDIFDNKAIPMQTWLDVSFGASKIHRGNMLSAAQLSAPPTEVVYTPKQDTLTTLILTNLDSHPLDSTKEVVHWMVCNIPEGRVSDGDTAMEYLPPLAWKGTGHHRHVFALYSHTDPISVGDQVGHPNTLGGRTFSSWQFTSSLGLTPVGLAWCQVHWDESVGETCELLHDVGGEPQFDLEHYDDPKTELKKLVKEARELNFRS